MSDARYLLDTSALLTLIEDEDGAARVETLLRQPSTIISWVSLLEVAYITRQERDATEADHRYALLKALPVSLLWTVDEPTLLAAARLKAQHRLSLADTIIAAYAIQMGAILVHKDPEFEHVADQVTLEALPYKPKQRRENR
jgi:predicted nucleic acid-binding protein